ncbi:MAG: hypothetical protein IEMM0008_0879 [bacterium]|nr:MAG: hypothetical protein IEMM0008_0879 [bacterium]
MRSSWSGHWFIENRLHYVRDETLGEDRCRVGNGSQVSASLRNGLLNLFRINQMNNVAAEIRRLQNYTGEYKKYLYNKL